MINILTFNLDRTNTYRQFFQKIGDRNYNFIVRWNDYCNCFFLDITDINTNYLIRGLALTNNLKIRYHDIPFVMVFSHIEGEAYEPTIDNISEFGLMYNDGVK